MKPLTRSYPAIPAVSKARLVHIGPEIDGVWRGLCGIEATRVNDHGHSLPAGYVICEDCEWKAAEEGWFVDA